MDAFHHRLALSFSRFVCFWCVYFKVCVRLCAWCHTREMINLHTKSEDIHM